MYRTRLILIVAAVLASLVAAVPTLEAAGAGQIRYVDPDGSDSAAGNSAAPWETLQHAVDSVGPGDTIMVNPGGYAGMRIETSGAPGAWIRLLSTDRGVVINRPGPNNKHDSNVEIETWAGTGTVSYWVIAGLEVTGAPNWGIDVRGNPTDHSHHIIVRDNNVTMNGVNSVKSGIFFAFTDDVTVLRNESTYNGEHGVYLSNSGDHFTVRHNLLDNNQRCGLHMNGDLSQGGDGLISHGWVDGNGISGNGQEGCAGINMDGVTDTVISNNLITDNGGSGIAIFKQDGALCSRRNQILNNTVQQPQFGRWALVIAGPGCRDNTVRNNILLSDHAFRGAIEMPTTAIAGLDSDYNIVADRFTVNDGDSVIDLGQWQADTGQDSHSIAATAADIVWDRYHRPTPGSIAEDAGVAVDLDHDGHGVIRPSGAGYDIGAHETPYCHGRRATEIGTRVADNLAGSSGDDVVVGLGGDDFLEGGDGDDIVCSGAGRDTIFGGPGHDFLRGGKDADIIRGGRGNDRIFGNRGHDKLYGKSGNDFIRGGNGTDTANGGAGNDDCRAETRLKCE